MCQRRKALAGHKPKAPAPRKRVMHQLRQSSCMWWLQGRCKGCGGGNRCKTDKCPNGAVGAIDHICCSCMPKCEGEHFDIADGSSRPCTCAGLLDKVAGSRGQTPLA